MPQLLAIVKISVERLHKLIHELQEKICNEQHAHEQKRKSQGATSNEEGTYEDFQKDMTILKAYKASYRSLSETGCHIDVIMDKLDVMHESVAFNNITHLDIVAELEKLKRMNNAPTYPLNPERGRLRVGIEEEDDEEDDEEDEEYEDDGDNEEEQNDGDK
jgi:hypothetical protein